MRCRLRLHRWRYHESFWGSGGIYSVRCKRCGAERLRGFGIIS
jgi:hypothetical protein